MRHQMIGLAALAVTVVAAAPRTASAQVSQFHSCGGRTTPNSNEVFIWANGNDVVPPGAYRHWGLREPEAEISMKGPFPGH